MKRTQEFPTTEYNSDHSTHGIICTIYDQGRAYQSISDFLAAGSPFRILQVHTLVHRILPALKQVALSLAESVAQRACRRAVEPGRWSGTPTPAHLVAEVLLDRAFRRGPSPTAETREARVAWIQRLGVADPTCLRLSILALPLRDQNPAKNDGVLPDLGEVGAMLRMWAVAKAISLAMGEAKRPQEGWACVRALIVRDPRRYPPFLTFTAQAFETYASALANLHQALGLLDLLEVTTLEEVAARIPREVLDDFQARRERVYLEKEDEGLRVLAGEKDALLALERKPFSQLMNQLAPGRNAPTLVETVLHSRRHPELDSLSPCDQLQFLASIFKVHANPQWESLRRQVLWNSIRGMVQYLAAYEANTGSKNNQGLDDLELYVPHHLRLSIHRKPESSRQFSVNLGPTLTRTPWHGTAAFYYSTRRKAVALETRLSLELKQENYVPILLSAKEEDPAQFRRMAETRQPVAWVSKALLEEESGSPDGSDERWVIDLVVNRLRYF